MMSGYAKLFSTIITSSIWSEDDKTRIVWITMLALADKYGNVQASIPGLAATSRVTIAECEAALRILSDPDPYSRSKDSEGRRIEAIEGGWHLLNYGKYRKMKRSAERTEYLRIKQREHRERERRTQAGGQPVNNLSTRQPLSTTVNPGQPIAEADVDVEADKKKRKKAARHVEYTPDFELLWTEYPRKENKLRAFAVWQALAPDGALQERIRASVQEHKTCEQWVRDGGRFIPLLTTFLNGRRWEDVLPAKLQGKFEGTQQETSNGTRKNERTRRRERLEDQEYGELLDPERGRADR